MSTLSEHSSIEVVRRTYHIQEADDVNIPAHSHAVERPINRGRPADLDDVVHTLAVRQLEDLLVKVRRLGIIDDVGRAELFHFFELLVGRGGDDHSSAGCSSKLKGGSVRECQYPGYA